MATRPNEPITKARIFLAYLASRRAMTTFAKRLELSEHFLWQIQARYRKVAVAVIMRMKEYIDPDAWFSVVSTEEGKTPSDFIDNPDIQKWLISVGADKLADELLEEWRENRAPRGPNRVR